jgi:predicted SAM-dependent methyltransferase
LKFSDLKEPIRLYAGDIPSWRKDNIVGLSLTRDDSRHIRHDITIPFPLEDETVDRFESESVFEYITQIKLVPIINEIYRILKMGGLFRLSVPDYRGPIMYDRCLKCDGKIYEDPIGGYDVMWFPTIETLVGIIERTKFKNVEYLQYYMPDGTPVVKKIDHSLGKIQRTSDFDIRVKDTGLPLSLVVDLTK